MPELPEVETTLRGIKPHLIERKIESINIRQTKLRWDITTDLENLMQGQVVKHLTRRGKYIGLHTKDGTLMIHLGMSGSLHFVPANSPFSSHDHVDFCFQGNEPWLRYTDPRRFGSILWIKGDWQEHKLLRRLGPEPLSDAFNVEYLYKKAKTRKVAVKTFIMDTRIVVGIGNIYANEVLFMSGIWPGSIVADIDETSLKRLVKCIKIVLTMAIEKGGTTLKNFVGSDGSAGRFRQELAVYGRMGKPCIKCGKILKKIRQNQRCTVFCTNCQI